MTSMDEDDLLESLEVPSSDLLCFANGMKNLEVSPLRCRVDCSRSLDNRHGIESHSSGIVTDEIAKVVSAVKVAIRSGNNDNNTVMEHSNCAESGSCEERYRDESCSAKASTNHNNHYGCRDESCAGRESTESTDNDHPSPSPCHDVSKVAAVVELMKDGKKVEAKQAFDRWFQNQSNKNNSKKNKVACPEKNCSKSVVDLIRHLIQVHKWDEHTARAARGMFGLRKVRPLKPGKVRKNYTSKICPIITCGKAVLRLSNHLRQTHNLTDKRYIKMLVDAGVPVKDTIRESLDESENCKGVRGVQQKVDGSASMKTPQEINEEDDADDSDASIVSEFDAEIEHEIIPTPSQKILFDAMKKWLMSLDGGQKKERDAKQHVSQLLAICKYFYTSDAGDICNVLLLFDAKFLREKWLEKFANERKPGTVKSYLHSLLHLCDFVKTCPEILQLDEEQPIVLALKVKYWLKTLNKSISIRRWEKREEDLEKIVGQEDFQAFEKSEPVRKAIKILSEYMGSSPAIKTKDFTCVRDYLISTLLIANASRSGAIANMTVGSVEKAVADGNTMVVTVRDHKTLQTSGPAMICMPKVIFSYLNIYITKMRARIVDINNSGHQNKVFITHTGMHMTSSAVCEQIGSFWKGAIGKHMNASLMRKSCVSVVHQNHPERKADLALHMNHAPKTAETSYFIQDKRAKSARTAEFLNAAIHAKIDDQRGNEEPEKSHDDLETIFASNIARKEIAMQDVHMAAKRYPSMKGNERNTYHKVRYIISKAEESLLPAECDTASDRVNRMRGNDESEKEKEKRQPENDELKEGSIDLFDNVNDQASDENDELSCATTEQRYSYTAKENKLITEAFGSFINSKGTIREDVIFSAFKENTTLRYLTKILSARQLADKVRTLKKTKKQKSKR